MPCTAPLRAWRSINGTVSLREPLDSQTLPYTYLRLPCGHCLGCFKSKSREWAFRCSLELKDHDQACWVTLTYDDDHLPATLEKCAVSGFIKRLRARVSPVSIRFFASGEYGERNARPHYHVILYGLHRNNPEITQAWPYGYARVDPLSPASIAYVAGYTSKKMGGQFYHKTTIISPESVDSDGVYYAPVYYQPPFVLMSRRPGIGGSSREFWRSWRSTAIFNGNPIPVPRFLHQSWLLQTSPSDHEVLATEKSLLPRSDSSPARLRAAAAIAASLLSHSSSRRHL